MRTRRPVVSNEVEHDAGVVTREEAGARGLRSLIALPLAIGERSFGVLVLYSRTPGGFTEDHVRLLEVLSPRLAAALVDAAIADEDSRPFATSAVRSLKLVQST